ncbi:hypothetical protein HLB44_19830 [Aquincola sp. S2]|uniref:Uncharacterized protein n=1 Tax=Pseudaquabacterium terrae TaxID=2732868 RepID=A0ABX2EL11_9BURK|nr:hypothetical protein [Aquabacterium terrae]NRF69251.1 hypothetical protein [Aquabacterium terrae]
MDMRLPAGVAAAADAPPPLRLLQRWTPPAPPQVPAPLHGWAACRQALQQLFLAR